jgi:hypothetical protein
LVEEKKNILDNHRSVLCSFGISTKDEELDLPSLYWIPKLHKCPFKQPYIAGSAKCSTKPLSKLLTCIRDRPFNLKGGLWFFVSFRIFFSDDTRVRIFIFIFFCRAKSEFFFQKLTLGYMTKTLNQIIFFPPPKSEYFKY